MGYSSEPWLELYGRSLDAVIGTPTLTQAVVRGGVQGYRTKIIRAGSQIEIETYPIWYTGAESKKARENLSTEAQQKHNAKNARKHFERKANTNFTDADCRIDLTYANDTLPDERQAQLDVQNFLRRVKYACRKKGLSPPRYMGVSEGKREGSRQKRVHHHILIGCGLSRDELEAAWQKGRVRAEHLQADRYGYTALARYLMKSPEGAKRYFCSRNLKEPKITVSDTRLSMRKVERLAMDIEQNAKEIYGKLMPGCELLESEVRRSDYVAGVYIYARMRKEDAHETAKRPAVPDRKRGADESVSMGADAARRAPGTGSAVPRAEWRKPKPD